MRRHLIRIYNILVMTGIDPVKLIRAIRGVPFYLRDLREFKAQQNESAITFKLGKAWPCFGDRHADGGVASGHYFHQDLLVARRIHNSNPNKHVDVGSRIDGFVSHVASFREIEIFDIRPILVPVPNIKFVQCDLMESVDGALVDCCDSISCLHALEHFGLGRYGDPVKYDGYIDGLNNLYKILKQNGMLYLSVPIGDQRIEFNAHRVFSIRYLLSLFRNKYEIIEFSYVDDNGDLHENVSLDSEINNENFGCTYGCGIFELRKK